LAGWLSRSRIGGGTAELARVGGQSVWILRKLLEAGNLGTALASINDDDLRGLSMRSTTRTILLQYAGEVVFTALAVLLRWLLDPVMGETLPLVTVSAAVAVAFWLSGYQPALIVVPFG
jgi:hypothetical protein